jgi:hypothetical protein
MNKSNSISICLNCYAIRFNEKRKTELKSISDIFGSIDIIKIAGEFIKTIDSKKYFKNQKEDRILYLKQTLHANKNENIYSGVLMKGHNGAESTIDEIIGGKIETIGRIDKENFNCLPYFFLLYIDSNEPNHILFMAQSYRQYGFKEIFEEAFCKYIETRNQELVVKFNPLSIASLFEKYISAGNINKLRFVKHGLLKNVESVLKGDKYKKETYEMEMSIKSKNGFLGIKESMKYDNASFIEAVQIHDFPYDEAYADISVAGRKRVVNITKPSNFTASYDITNEIRINENTNLPVFEDIQLQALDILNNDLIPYL